MKVTNETGLNMVIGNPLEHSQSPVLHEAIYKLLDINAVLLAKRHSQLKSLIQAIKILSVELIAVTLPFKEKVLKYIDQCSPEVIALKAANTLIQRNGTLYGFNTDVDGIEFALRDISLQNKNVLVIGAGGAARAMGYVLQNNNARIFWINRTRRKSIILANEFSGAVISNAKLNTLCVDIIINTTPVDLSPHNTISPLSEYTFGAHHVVFDMNYNPLMTNLLIRAKKSKAHIISGLDMFIGQGLKQIELFTGKRIYTPIIVDKLRKLLIQNQRAVRK